jgi:hypothetical protein
VLGREYHNRESFWRHFSFQNCGSIEDRRRKSPRLPERGILPGSLKFETDRMLLKVESYSLVNICRIRHLKKHEPKTWIQNKYLRYYYNLMQKKPLLNRKIWEYLKRNTTIPCTGDKGFVERRWVLHLIRWPGMFVGSWKKFCEVFLKYIEIWGNYRKFSPARKSPCLNMRKSVAFASYCSYASIVLPARYSAYVTL